MQVDLFFYREPEEAKEPEDELAVADYKDYGAGNLGMEDWSANITDAQWAGDAAAAPISGAPVASGGWTAEGKPFDLTITPVVHLILMIIIILFEFDLVFMHVCIFFFSAPVAGGADGWDVVDAPAPAPAPVPTTDVAAAASGWE